VAGSAAGVLLVHRDPALAEVDLAEVVELVVAAAGEGVAQGEAVAAEGHLAEKDQAVALPAGRGLGGPAALLSNHSALNRPASAS
jgi:hypothetical protein